MSTIDTFPTIRGIAFQVACITDEEMAEIQKYFARRNAIGPILDPTAYRNEMRLAESAQSVFDAFVSFRSVIKQVIAEELADRKSKEPVKEQ